jgi:AraC-like DNA-binding protein
MSTLAKFIDSLHVHFYRAAFREVIVPVQLNGCVEKNNLIIMLNRGHMQVGPEGREIPERSFYFFPTGQPVFIGHGEGNHQDVGQTGFTSEEHRSGFLRTVSIREDFSKINEMFTIVRFDVLLYDAIPFFEVLEMPPFHLPADEELGFLLRHITIENELNKLGREKIVSNYMEEIMIHVCRYMESQPDFKKYIDKLDFLTDRRLVDIVKYIRENLDKDLSNKTIANIAFISEDYVGQFFKSLTGKNLQDYIENQRLERALFLLRTQPDNIQEIAHRVGFKDPAYFSRRFKMKFGSNANAIRQNRNQLA